MIQMQMSLVHIVLNEQYVQYTKSTLSKYPMYSTTQIKEKIRE